jgi:hypothetical protein
MGKRYNIDKLSSISTLIYWTTVTKFKTQRKALSHSEAVVSVMKNIMTLIQSLTTEIETEVSKESISNLNQQTDFEREYI